MAITVCIADGHSIFMKGIAEKLRKEKGFSVTVSGEQDLSVLEYITRRSPDVFIYDKDINGESSGFPLLREIRKVCGSRVRIIAISEIEKIESCRRFLHLGGNGYLIRSTAEEEIIHAVRVVTRDCLFICYHLQDSFIRKSLAVAPPQGSEFLA